MAHTCPTIVVSCMDFRIHGTVQALLQDIDVQPGTYDLVAVAGGAANTDQLRYHLELSQRLHQSTRAILTIHEDCGAGAKPADLTEAAKLARELGFQPELYVIKLDGSWEQAVA